MNLRMRRPISTRKKWTVLLLSERNSQIPRLTSSLAQNHLNSSTISLRHITFLWKFGTFGLSLTRLGGRFFKKIAKPFSLSAPQAHRQSTPDHSQTPVITTTPDVVFYILKSVITTRLLTTGSLSGLNTTLRQLRDVIDRDYIGVIKRKLDDVYRNQGPTPSNVRTDRVERENRSSFIVSCFPFSPLDHRQLVLDPPQ